MILLKKYWLHLALVAIALTVAWQMWKPNPPIQETYHAPTVQKDGSTIIEVKPDAKAKPAHITPKGGTVERVVKVVVKPRKSSQVKPARTPDIGIPTSEQNQVVECPPVTVDLSLVRLPDESKRVIASSPDGEIISSVDIPVESARPVPKENVWAVGVVADPFKHTMGGFVDRDFGWSGRFASLVQRNNGDIPNQVWVKVGVRF